MKRTERIEKSITAMLCMQRQCWEHAVGGRALIHAGKCEMAVLFAKDAALRQRPDGRPGMVEDCTASTDAIAHMPVLAYALQETRDAKLETALSEMKRYAYEVAPRDAEGTLYHVIDAPQFWSDCTYMAPPSFATIGDFNESMKQFRGAKKALWDSEKKMMRHIYDDGKKVWIRDKFWGGGNGWTAAGLAEVLCMLPAEMSAEKAELTAWLEEILTGCMAYRRADGLFHDVIDEPDTFIESNLGQMLAFAIYHSVTGGHLSERWLKEAHIMREAAIHKIDEYGVIQGACSSPAFDRSGTSTEAQAFTIMMETAAAAFVQD